jgi:putative salt-induced outer membrane protein
MRPGSPRLSSDARMLVRLATFVTTLLVSAVVPVVAQSADAPEFVALERTLADAIHEKDLTTLERLLAPGFVMRGNPDVSRETWVENALKYCWGDRSDITDLADRPSTGMAVVTFVLTFYTNPVTCEDQTNASLITDIWALRDGNWQLLVRHSAPLADAGADVIAQQFATIPEPPALLEGQGELSFVSTGGNSETQTLGTSGSLIWRPGKWTTSVKAAFVDAETDGIRSARSLTAELRESRQLSPRMELYGHGSYRRDLFAGIENRYTVDGGVAFLLLDEAPHSLKIDVGAGYVYEDRLTEPVSRFAAATAGADYQWTINDRSVLSDTFGFTANLQEGDDWRYSNLLSLTVELNRTFALKLSHTANYLNQPVAGFEKLDTITSFSLVTTFKRRAN